MRVAALVVVAGCSFQAGNPAGGGGLAPPPMQQADASDQPIDAAGTGSGSGSSTIDAHPVDAAVPPATCPSGYASLPMAPISSKYRIFNWDSSPGQSSARPWTTAASACQNDGTHLAIINNNAEAGALGAAIRVDPQSPYYWDGVTDTGHEGTWTTVLGATAPYLPWAQGQPNGGPQANCAITYGGHLYDWTCGTYYPFACECE